MFFSLCRVDPVFTEAAPFRCPRTVQRAAVEHLHPVAQGLLNETRLLGHRILCAHGGRPAKPAFKKRPASRGPMVGMVIRDRG